MNLLLFDRAELHVRDDDGGVEIELAADDRRARHLRDVLRAEPGQSVRAGVVRGATGRAQVLATDEHRVRLRLVLDGPAGPLPSPSPPSPPSPPSINLIVAVPRPKVLPRVLQTAASFGVARIDLVNAWRVERSYLASPRLADEQLAAALRSGCEQGGTTWVPDIELHPLFMPFLRRAPERWPAGHRIVAHPRVSSAIETAIPPGTRAPILLAIGPEGGWIDRELASFAGLGFTAVSLGPAVLRVEAALAAALGQLQLLRRLTP